MHPRISLNTISSLTWPLQRDLAMLDRLGASCFGFPLLKIEDDIEAGIQAIRTNGPPVSCVAASTADVSLLTSQSALEALAPAIDVAQAVDSPLCYFTSGRTPARLPTDQAFDQLVAALPASVDYARQKGVQLAVENNSVTNRTIGFVHTLVDTLRLSAEADLTICLELQNCWYERDLPRLFREGISRIGLVQVSDFRVGEELRLNRRPLGDGSMPVSWLVEQLLEAGYAGCFDIEVIGPSVDQEGPEEALRRSADWLSERLVEMGA